MANKDYKAFIVEGEVREPQIIDNISKIFFAHKNYKVITLPAGENIYMLWKQLNEDDFDTDVIEVLRENNTEVRKQLSGLSRDDFSEVYLFFDYDAHQTNLGRSVTEDIIPQMLASFDNETENGKLYISYPMVEALRDFAPGKCGGGSDCFVDVKEFGDYKNTSALRAFNPHFKEYDIDVWREIIDIFVMRLTCLCEEISAITYEKYVEKITPNEIYNAERKTAEYERIFVLSAFPEFLIDYFGVRLWKTSVKHTRIQKIKNQCVKRI